MTETVTVPLGERSYEILIGNGLLAEAGSAIAARLSSRRARIVCDEAVSTTHLTTLTTSLTKAGFDIGQPVIVAPGEGSKSFATYQSVAETLLASRIERSTILIALGGGVIGDLTGFLAATLLRGLDFVQVPTTLLSQVDSSVGGKTGINTSAGKNLVGAFHQPKLVLIDVATLETLPRRELLCGYAEMIKHELIASPSHFGTFETDAKSMLEGDISKRIWAIRRSCEVKAGVVSRDEHEGGERALLNFGHTFGHALEALTGYGEALKHGEAVALGTLMALELSVEMGLCPEQDRDRVLKHYRDVGLPTAIKPSWKLSTNAMTEAMATDKKSERGRIAFILSRGIGSAFVSRDVPQEALRATLDRALD
jgi:3-dehydroquinate synthase